MIEWDQPRRFQRHRQQLMITLGEFQAPICRYCSCSAVSSNDL